jgi:hypothetical protein
MSSHNNNCYYKIGDLVKRTNTWDSFSRGQTGVVVEIGTILDNPPAGEELIKVCWENGYGTYWAKTKYIKLLAQAKKNA